MGKADGLSVQYAQIGRVVVDTKGNLILWQSNAIIPKQRAFHPAGEWFWITNVVHGIVEVGIAPLLQFMEAIKNED